MSLLITMPGRMPAKKFRTVLFDKSAAARLLGRQMNKFSINPNLGADIYSNVNYTIKNRLMKVYILIKDGGGEMVFIVE
jgi:hypothetical protein